MKNPALLEEMGRARERSPSIHTIADLITRRFAELVETMLQLPSMPRPGDESDAAAHREMEEVVPMPAE